MIIDLIRLAADPATIAGFNPLTGFEHSRLMTLLSILTVISLIVWVAAGVAIVIRQIALLMIRLLRYSDNPRSASDEVKRQDG